MIAGMESSGSGDRTVPYGPGAFPEAQHMAAAHTAGAQLLTEGTELMTRSISSTQRAAARVVARHPHRAWAWARAHLPRQHAGKAQQATAAIRACADNFPAEPQQV